MPKQSSKRSKTKRNDISDSESSDDEPMHFFVPGERINVDALSFFLFNYIDKTPKIRPCQHPTDKNRTGFNVTAQRVLNIINLRDIMSDTRDWDTESSARSFKQQPYRYHESDTAKRRLRAGPSKPAETTETTKSTSPPISAPVQAGGYSHFSQQQQQQQQQQYQYQQQQPSSDYLRSGGGFPPTSSKPETQSSTYNINYTSVNTQYTANVPGASHLAGNTTAYQKAYPSTNYPPQISSKLPHDIPPTFEQSTPRVPPRNPQPGQPDPDAFDTDVKPPRSSAMEIPGSRQGSLAPTDEQANRYGGTNRTGDQYNSGPQRQSQYDASRRPGYRG